MKKGLIALIISFIAFVSLISMSSCSEAPKKLGAPEGLKRDRRVMIWDPVENASGYKVSINDEEYTVTECRFELYYLDGGTYEFEVMALGNGKTFTDSDPIYIMIELSDPVAHFEEPVFMYTLLKDRSGYRLEVNYYIFNSPEETMVIPDFFGDYPITEVMNLNVLADPNSMKCLANTVTKYVILPKYLKVIQGKTFYKMSNLREIVIPDSVTDIYESAFQECKSLTKVVLSKELREIHRNCFKNTPLNEITIPDTVETIGPSAFECETIYTQTGINHVSSGLSEIYIPDSVKTIGDGAFRGRERLKTIILPDTVESLGKGVFDDTLWYSVQDEGGVYLGNWLVGYKGNKDALTEFDIPAGTRVSGEFFANQTSLTKVTLGNGAILEGIGHFKGCTSLTTVILPSGMKKIPKAAFYQTTSLKNIILPDSITEIGESAFSHSGLESITLPAGLKNIGENAFAFTSLSKVSFNGGLEKIDRGAFLKCTELTEVILPSSLKELGVLAFSGCTSLTFAVVPGTIEKLFDDIFYDCQALETVYFIGTADELIDLKIKSNTAPSDKPFSDATVLYYSESEPTNAGNKWHFVNGRPQKW